MGGFDPQRYTLSRRVVIRLLIRVTAFRFELSLQKQEASTNLSFPIQNAASFPSSDTTAAVKYGLVAIIVMVLPLLVMFPVHAGVQSV